MKLIISLIVIAGIVLFLVFQFGGYATLDPAKQMEQFKNNVKPGMTWQQVADVRAPSKYVPLSPDTINGERQPVKFNRDRLAQKIKDDGLKHGFLFRYRFTDADGYKVVFDSAGEARHVTEMFTKRDLLEGKAFKR